MNKIKCFWRQKNKKCSFFLDIKIWTQNNLNKRRIINIPYIYLEHKKNLCTLFFNRLIVRYLPIKISFKNEFNVNNNYDACFLISQYGLRLYQYFQLVFFVVLATTQRRHYKERVTDVTHTCEILGISTHHVFDQNQNV